MSSLFLCCGLVMSSGSMMMPPEGQPMSTTTDQSDRAKILAHVRSIFDAYVGRDRERIERTHTRDWRGFLIPSTEIERGIEAYMKHADNSLERLHGTGYELHDTEIQLYGDVGVLYYVATYSGRDPEGNEISLALRSVDIYRREGEEWNQCGSNICLVPQDPGAAAGFGGSVETRALTPGQREELLGAREAVWRAWFSGDSEGLRAAVPEDVIAIDAGSEQWADLDGVQARAAKFVEGGSRLVRLEFPETRIQAYGSVAVLYTTYLFEVEKQGERTVHTGRGTEVFVRREGRWMNTGWHLDSGA